MLISHEMEYSTSNLCKHLNQNTVLFRMRSIFRLFRVPGSSVGKAGAPYTEAMSLLQQTWVQFHLWPFAACHSPSLSPVSCLLFSCPENKGTKSPPKYIKNIRVIAVHVNVLILGVLACWCLADGKILQGCWQKGTEPPLFLKEAQILRHLQKDAADVLSVCGGKCSMPSAGEAV